jgi:hypothetical protein
MLSSRKSMPYAPGGEELRTKADRAPTGTAPPATSARGSRGSTRAFFRRQVEMACKCPGRHDPDPGLQSPLAHASAFHASLRARRATGRASRSLSEFRCRGRRRTSWMRIASRRTRTSSLPCVTGPCRDGLLELDAAVHRDQDIVVAPHAVQEVAVLDASPAAADHGVNIVAAEFLGRGLLASARQEGRAAAKSESRARSSAARASSRLTDGN